MMAAKRLKGLGWIALAFLVAIACYLVSLQVASERNRLQGVNARILAAKRDIRQLETEFATRASLRQLERWNGEVLALSAPASSQFVHDERQLASMDFDARPEADGGSPTMLALVSAATDQPVLVAAPVRTAQNIARPIPVPTASPIVTAIARAVVPTANAATRDPRPAPKPRRAASDPVLERQAAVDTRRAQRVAMLETKLLGDDVLGDLTRTARAEARSR